MSRIVDTIRSGPSDPQPQQASIVEDRTGNPDLGVAAYFHFQDTEKVERVVDELTSLGVTHLRTSISWHDYVNDGGRDWYDWLLPKLVERFEVLPCVLYTPTHLGILPKTSSPPRDPEDYARFVDHILTEYAGSFSAVELWNEPNNYIEWDWTVDPEWAIFATMIGSASAVAHEHGVRTVLGGMSPMDPNWLHLMFNRGAMNDIDVLGIHGFPGTWEAVWDGWARQVGGAQDVLAANKSEAEIWITECGFSTWQHDEFRMLTELVDVAAAPVPRVYWYSAEDLAPERETLDGFHADERAYHFGLFEVSGKPKLAARVWRDHGFDAVRSFAELGRRVAVTRETRPTLITGGAGFVGTNLADRLAREGKPVVVLDNLSRPGVERNLRWLTDTHGGLITAEIGDLRDRFVIRRALAEADEVVHLAAQVAVTTSLEEPVHDLDVNLRGTFNLLEEMRRLDVPPPILFTSTNKVYGHLEDIKLEEGETRYEPTDPGIAARGIGEARPLEFVSPYGCSKGAADQYVLDYARSFGFRTAVFRMSCIYGPHQFGTEDQGWVAHFLIQAISGAPITIYGDGKQVRDILFVEDLVDAMRMLFENAPSLMDGRAFNIGGGVTNTVSLVELIDQIAQLHGQAPDVTFTDWRTGDQRYFVTDTSNFEAATGWQPRVAVRPGLQALYQWLLEHGRHTAEAVARTGRS